MNFVKYSTALFPRLNNTPEIILQSSINTLYVNSITICNTSINDIRINLIKKTIGTDSSSNQVNIVNNIKVEPVSTGKIDSKNTVNLISLFNLELFLPVMTTSGITYTTELICYSNGIQQNFDCSIDYTTFVETPIRY